MIMARFVPLLRRARRLLVLALVLGVAAGLAVGWQASNADYTSTARVLVSGVPSGDGSDSAYNAAQYATDRMSTYTQLATSDPVVTTASGAVGIDATSLPPRISTAVDAGSNVLALSVREPDPQVALATDQALTQAMVQAISTLETPPGQPPRVQVEVASQASRPASRQLPPLPVFAGGGALVGLLATLLAVAAVNTPEYRKLRSTVTRRWRRRGLRSSSRPATAGDTTPRASGGADGAHEPRLETPLNSRPGPVTDHPHIEDRGAGAAAVEPARRFVDALESEPARRGGTSTPRSRGTTPTRAGLIVPRNSAPPGDRA